MSRADLVPIVALGVLGLLSGMYDPWVEEKGVSVFVSLSRAVATIFYYLAALGCLTWILVTEDKMTPAFSVLVATSTLGAGAAMHAFGRCVHMVVLVGQGTDQLLRNCNGPVPLGSNPGALGKGSAFVIVIGFICFIIRNSSLAAFWKPIVEKFFCRDIPYNWKMVMTGSAPNQPFICCCTLIGFKNRAGPLFALVLDVLVVAFLLLFVLPATMIEAILVLPGACAIAIFLLVFYDRELDNNPRQVHLSWSDMITCSGCDQGHPSRNILSCVRCNFVPPNLPPLTCGCQSPQPKRTCTKNVQIMLLDN